MAQGLFVRPATLSGIDNDHPVCTDEIFGPVTCILPFDDVDEAIERANESEYGLAATVWTRDSGAALRAVNELEAGFVQVNQNLVVQPTLPYGGYKSQAWVKRLRWMPCWSTLHTVRPSFLIWTQGQTVIMRVELEGAVVLVTGASSGIVKAVEVLADRPRAVIMVARRRARLEALAKRMSALHPKVDYVVSPATSTLGPMSSPVQLTEERFGGVDVPETTPASVIFF